MSKMSEHYDYKREDFKEWLEELPPDEPFCTENRCPIVQYIHEGLDYNGRDATYTEIDASDDDFEFTMRLDRLAKAQFSINWEHITARDCLSILKELEKRNENSNEV